MGITCTRRRVTGINLYNQSLEGSLISALGRLSRLQTLNLSTNQFSGEIPSELGLASDLEILDIRSNNLTGALPPSLGDLTNLTSLVVSNNNLAGIIPTSIGGLLSLRNMNLSGNSFSGTLPSSLGQLNRLETLHIAGNNLTGMIPQNLTACTALQDIDLSNNNISGFIPFQNMKNLTSLHLQNNILEGNILNITTFPILEDLDLTNNRLGGEIPQNIGIVTLKKNLLLARNNLTGSIPDGIGELSLVERIDLSANKLSGSIPEAISKCISLIELTVASNSLTGNFSVPVGAFPNLMKLNVSHNSLNASLPTLDHLLNLKVFDGSFNDFVGEVPSTFVNFPSLVHLNVSSNRLSGELPFFASHDSVGAQSFLNNSELCGSILDKSCGSSKIATSTIIYIVLGSVAGLLALVSIASFIVSCRGRKRKGSRNSAQISAELQLKLSAEEILTATNRFSNENYIGEGKLSTVYKGVLPDQTVVAVKRLAITSAEGEDAENKLNAELESLGHIRHRSLVKVLGYCSSPDVKALVLDYMPNGSLESLLHPLQNAEVIQAFDWTARFNIAVEVAEGIRYLHHESRNPVVHGDVKPSNILIDAKMEAKIGDFEVARILTQQRASPSMGITTPNGYTPPGKHQQSICSITSLTTMTSAWVEKVVDWTFVVFLAHSKVGDACNRLITDSSFLTNLTSSMSLTDVWESGVPSKKGDVYSFGIVMLEMISGRSPDRLEPAQTLPQWVRATVSNSKALHNVLDPLLMSDLVAHQQKMAMVLGVALLCTRIKPEERPHMDDVYKMLVHIRTKLADADARQTSRRRGWRSERRNSSAGRRQSDIEVKVVTQPQLPQQTLPHTPSLSDWTPPSQV